MISDVIKQMGHYSYRTMASQTHELSNVTNNRMLQSHSGRVEIRFDLFLQHSGTVRFHFEVRTACLQSVGT
jgi:hypothetical protein